MNPYGFLHTPLKRARLPISPPERIAENRERQYITIKGCVKAQCDRNGISPIRETCFLAGRAEFKTNSGSGEANTVSQRGEIGSSPHLFASLLCLQMVVQ